EDWKDKKKQKRSKTSKKREKDKESRARQRIQPEITAGSARHSQTQSKIEIKEVKSQKSSQGAKNVKAPRESRNREPIRRDVTVETTETKALVAQDGLGYDWSDQAKEGPTNFALIAYTSSGSSSSDSEVSACSKACLKSHETLKEHYNNLTKAFNKSQLNAGAYKAVLESVDARLDVYKKNEENERYKTSEGYHVVPPPYTGNFMPLKYDLISDNEDENETEFKSKQRKPKFAKTEFDKSNEHVKTAKESVKKVEKKKQAKYPRKNSQSPRGAQLSKAAVSVNTARPINTAYIRPTVNSARKASNVLNKAHTHVRRPFNKSTINKNNNLKEKVNTVKGDATTVGPKAIGNPQAKNLAGKRSKLTVEGQRHIDLEQSIPQHIYEEIDGGFVAFRGDPKGGRITGKGRKLALSFMRPFGCPVTILNTLDHLGKFDGKADEGFFVGYSTNSKVYRDSPDAGFKPSGEEKKIDSKHQENEDSEVLNINNDQERIDSSTKDVNTAGPSINTASENINTGSPNINTASPILSDSSMQSLENTGTFDDAYDDREVGAEADLNNLETTMNVSPIPKTRIHKDHPKDQISRDINSATQTRRMTKISKEHAMTLMDLPKGKRAIGTKWVYRNNKDERGVVVRNKTRLVAQGYTQEEGIDYDEVFAHVAKIEAIRYRRGTIDKTLFIKKDRSDILLVQVYVDDIIFGSTKKSLCVKFEQMMHKRFHMISIGELTFLLGLQVQQKEDGIFISQDKYVADILKKFDCVTVKITSTPMEPNNALVKDEKGEDMDVHLYRSMIGSLMYLTASRPDITFAVCACARFQVTPKISHLHAVKRIFRYLKGQPKLGLWYHMDLPFDLEAFSDSDYAGASLDRKSITGVETIHKELGDRMKRAITMASSLEAEQDSDPQTRFETTSKQSNDPSLSRVNTLGSREDNMKLKELMEHC
ncbi:putative ribonuclease H-like domain-containing protein, partial [Tanacetum coccineum]